MVEESLSACAFMILSMLADHPYCEVTMQHGDWTKRFDTRTFSTFFVQDFLHDGAQILELGATPYCDVTMQHGDWTKRFDTRTFSTFLSKISFMTVHKFSNLALASSNFFFSSS